MEVDARWSAAAPLEGRIELVRNGVVVAARDASAPGDLHARVDFSDSGWIAARRMDAHGHQLQTGAVFVIVNKASVRASASDADFFVSFIDNLIRQTSAGGAWGSFFAHDREVAQARYRRAKGVYERIAAEARKQGH